MQVRLDSPASRRGGYARFELEALRVLHDLKEFLDLSAGLNYQLSAATVDWRNVLGIIVNEAPISESDQALYDLVFSYLASAYGGRKRRLGPLAILHPLRAAALLVRALERPARLEILTALLHDSYEELGVRDASGSAVDSSLEEEFRPFLEPLRSDERWYLMERLKWITRRPGECYCEYTTGLLEKAIRTPEILRAKLADRLDNTLDLRVDHQDPLAKVDFFELIFREMFIGDGASGRHAGRPALASAFSDADRLYQLFKDSLLMTLVRKSESDRADPICHKLFEALALAGGKEAQRIALQSLRMAGKNNLQARKLLLATMEYVERGGVDRVTPPGSDNRLDGLFISVFRDAGSRDPGRFRRLNDDKDLMFQAAMAFVAIFLRFLHEPGFFIHGISSAGVAAPGELV
ncbi:MAG: hypothetical protein EHM61_20225 [Acidobacteria bacterium]|nr:MAG: hypothetical protein EHM61_20225 [Acidobacteriota bacterium]